MSNNITKADAGVWLDGAYGWTNTYRVIDTAVEYEFKLSDLGVASLDAYKTKDVVGLEDLTAEECASLGGWDNIHELVSELSADATDYLQSLVTDDDLYFIWDAGELSLQEVDEEGEPVL